MISINIYVIAMQMLNFLVLIWLLKKFLVKPLGEFLEKRKSIIQNNIESAEKDKQDAVRLLEDQKEALQKAYQDAKEIREKTETAALKGKEDILNKAKDESIQLLSNTKVEIDQQVSNAKKELKTHIGELAINLSSQLIKKNMDEKTQEGVIKEFIGASAK